MSTATGAGGPGGSGAAWDALDSAVTGCRACPRLVAWREEVAATKRAAYREEEYWGRPVPGFGDGSASVLVLGLAPAAHGGNRTGRVFTGDRSGDWLFAALHRTGYANQPTSTHAGDGLELTDVRVTASVRCAPPANRPLPQERDECAHWLHEEVRLLLPTLRTVVVLGGFSWDAGLRVLSAMGWTVPRPRPVFGHGAEIVLEPGPSAPAGARPLTLLGCYHVSQQNTFTGRLTEDMLDSVLRRARMVSPDAPPP